MNRTSERRWRPVLAWALFLGTIGVLTASFVVYGLRLARGSTSAADVLTSLFGLGLVAFAFAVVGVLVALRRPENPAGWQMLVIGLFWSVAASPPSAATNGNFLDAIGSVVWVLPFGLMSTHLLLRLPNGALLSPRWRWVSRAATLAIVLASFIPDEDGGTFSPIVVAALVGLLLLVGCSLASILSLVLRARRAGADERRQIRWVAAGAGSFLTMYVVSFIPSWLGAADNSVVVLAAQYLTGLGYAAIPVSIGISILRFRLYAIDVVIRKAVVVAAIAVFFGAVYALVVGGIGALVASSSSTALSFAAAAIVAILFQPVLARARRFADRVVYGRRATPYEVLAEFGDRLAETYAADDVLPRTARLLAEGVGADRARVWLWADGALRPVATWSRDDIDPSRDDDHRTEVRHQGELLGALSVAMPLNDPMDPSKEKLVSDLASQAGLLLRNVRLLEDLRASRRRLVSAQDEERRKLERNIHDGAQQQLVALTVKARLARQFTERDPDRAAEMLAQIETETQQALEDLRDLARGIYPPLLADKGLPDALASQARKSPIPVEVDASGIGRYSQDVEAAVYFSVLEALQNVAKYAQATRATIGLAQTDGHLRFEVRDDGKGFDPAATGYGTGMQGMADRLAALDGAIEVTSVIGTGTSVTGRIPAERRSGEG